jgi:hypothetical protein
MVPLKEFCPSSRYLHVAKSSSSPLLPSSHYSGDFRVFPEESVSKHIGLEMVPATNSRETRKSGECFR